MSIDYKALGKKVRIARLGCDLTQEQLAEQAGLSTTHISNIETGNTKLSLPSVVLIANVLNLSIDELLYGSISHSQTVYDKRAKELFDDCSETELRLLLEILEAAKSAIRNDTLLKELFCITE